MGTTQAKNPITGKLETAEWVGKDRLKWLMFELPVDEDTATFIVPKRLCEIGLSAEVVDLMMRSVLDANKVDERAVFFGLYEQKRND